MYATSSNNLEKQKSFQESVRSSLHITVTGAGGGAGDSTGSLSAGDLLKETLQQLKQPIDELPKHASGKEIKDFLERKMQDSGSEIAKSSVTQIRHEWFGVRMSLAASTFFQPGSFKLKLSSLEVLDEVFKDLKGRNNRFIIEGHTDSDPINQGAIESNWELSSLRATSVVRYLIKYQGLDPTRLTAAAYADSKPIASNQTAEGKQKNRRIDILIISDEKINSNGL